MFMSTSQPSSLIPLLLVGNQLVFNFLVNTNLFTDYFSYQCEIIENNISIPTDISFGTEILEFVQVILQRSLDPDKAHGHNEISIHMIKICASSISEPLAILFRSCLESECFHKKWKKANIVPFH